MAPSKIAGQVMLTGSLEDVYTCPEGQTIRCTIYLCNQDTAAGSIQLAIAKDGEDPSDKQMIYFDTAVPANDTLETKDFWLNEGDVIRAQGENNKTSCNVLINEIQNLAK